MSLNDFLLVALLGSIGLYLLYTAFAGGGHVHKWTPRIIAIAWILLCAIFGVLILLGY